MKCPSHSGPGPIKNLRVWALAARQRIKDRPVIISVSGGKDSTCTALLLKEAGIAFSSVHMDTGWEHPATEEYVRDYLPTIIGPVEVIQGRGGGMENLVRRKAMFPGRHNRFCTQELKVYPFKAYLETLDDEPVNAVGIRADESKARSKFTEWDENAGMDCTVWRPLLRWTYQDVIDMHHRHNVKPNPLYLQGATRVGCWPCIFAQKKEIRMIADIDPARIDRIRSLEGEMTQAAEERAAARGETLAEPHTWFKNPRRRAGPESKTAHLPIRSPIDEVVEWSRTKRGGTEFEPLAAPLADEGCMRWGMCETHDPGTAAPPTSPPNQSWPNSER